MFDEDKFFLYKKPKMENFSNEDSNQVFFSLKIRSLHYLESIKLKSIYLSKVTYIISNQ